MVMCILSVILYVLVFIVTKLLSPNKRRYTNKVTGRVVDKSKSNGNYRTFYPIFEYTVSGVTYRKTGNVAYNTRTIENMMLKEQTILYNPTNPSDAVLDNTKVIGIIQKSALAITVVFFIIGGIIIYYDV